MSQIRSDYITLIINAWEDGFLDFDDEESARAFALSNLDEMNDDEVLRTVRQMEAGYSVE